MPRKRVLDNGHEENRAVRTAKTGFDVGASRLSGLPGLPEKSHSEDAASRAFQGLLERTDGWLRCIPAGEGKLSYFKWKFSDGPHKGKYVMYVAHFYNWVDGICGLAEKVEEVDRGVRRPAQDTFYDPR